MGKTDFGGLLCQFGSVQLPNSSHVYDSLTQFNSAYHRLHPYISVTVCVFGMTLNVLNLVVLTRHSLIKHSINNVLTAMAVCDLVVMSSYLALTIQAFTGSFRYSASAMYKLAVFVLFHSNTSVICHATSIWLTVVLATIRVSTLARSLQGSTVHWDIPTVRRITVLVFLCVLILDVPTMVHVMYFTSVSVLGTQNNCFVLKLAFWSNGIIFKIIPCILLTFFIGVLLCILSEARHRSNRLCSLNSVRHHNFSCRDHITWMLITLLLSFLFTQLPQGLLLIGTGLYNHEFRSKVYNKLGELMDLFSLLNSAISFFIYCIMSQRFRQTFWHIFLPHCLRKHKLNFLPLQTLALSVDGTCTGEHGVGIDKKSYLEAEFGTDTLQVMKTLKRALDPNGILNPGKIFDW
ncbi:unnamed protein product [Soboliphyme baturini]|uniref:G_PROTEIN_RECEP_F1_2 domain-containing protein n=1 Tax=Soboliphyme baturini TaxID=241478 RepID=A0A183IPY2_9BILA|nr:unnamed protein product [Soboliphyme baturini]